MLNSSDFLNISTKNEISLSSTDNYITDKQMHKDDSRKASSENSTMEKVLFLPQTIKYNMRLRTGKTISVSRKVVINRNIRDDGNSN